MLPALPQIRHGMTVRRSGDRKKAGCETSSPGQQPEGTLGTLVCLLLKASSCRMTTGPKSIREVISSHLNRESVFFTYAIPYPTFRLNGPFLLVPSMGYVSASHFD